MSKDIIDKLYLERTVHVKRRRFSNYNLRVFSARVLC